LYFVQFVTESCRCLCAFFIAPLQASQPTNPLTQCNFGRCNWATKRRFGVRGNSENHCMGTTSLIFFFTKCSLWKLTIPQEVMKQPAKRNEMAMVSYLKILDYSSLASSLVRSWHIDTK
jgi:hypothetical protein